MDNIPLKLAKLIHDTSGEQPESSNKNHAEHQSVVEQACNEQGIMLEHKKHGMASKMISIGIIDFDSKCFEAFTRSPSGYGSNFKHVHRSFGSASSETIQHIEETDVIPDLV
jgi:hypothetical protein